MGIIVEDERFVKLLSVWHNVLGVLANPKETRRATRVNGMDLYERVYHL